MEKFEVVTFRISGRGEISGSIPEHIRDEMETIERRLPTFDFSGLDKDASYRAAQSALLSEVLNRKADRICAEMQNSLRQVLPLGSGITLQADLAFYSGSIIVEGSLALLGWASKTALEPIRDEMAGLIKIGVRRALRRSLSEFGVDVASVDVSADKPAAAPATTPMATPLPGAGQSTAHAYAAPGDRVWFIAFIGLLSLLVLLLLGDRLISIPRREAAPSAVPAATAPLPAPATR